MLPKAMLPLYDRPIIHHVVDQMQRMGIEDIYIVVNVFKEKVIQYFYIWLKPGGTLIMTTPNISSWDAKLFKQKWESFHKIPEHIYFFSPQSLKQTLQKKGFGNVEVKSWGFVRSIGFVMDKEFWGSGSLVKGSRNFLKRTGLYDVFIYFKMHNMMVIAHKN